jgi:hypothetical protein
MGVRRIARSRRSGEPDLVRILNDGVAYAYDQQGHRLPYPTIDELREAWKSHRAEILADYEGRETRPFGWWQFDCPVRPAWEWNLLHMGTVGGIRFRNRNRPSDDQQAEHLARIAKRHKK